MRAVVQDRYGSPDVLRIQDLPVPSPAAGQVRVKVAATALNLSDWEGLTGSPGYARLGGRPVGERRRFEHLRGGRHHVDHEPRRLGADRIEQVSPEAPTQRLRPGDG